MPHLSGTPDTLVDFHTGRHGHEAAPRRQRHVRRAARRRRVGHIKRRLAAADDDDAQSVEDGRLLVVLRVNDKTLEGSY